MKKDQISKEISSRIISGEYALHCAIPPERVLTGIFGVSRITVRSAIETLVNEGILERCGRSGTIVCGIPQVKSTDANSRKKNILYIFFSSIPDSRIEQSSKDGVVYRGIEKYTARMGYSLLSQTGENYLRNGVPDSVDGIIIGGTDLDKHFMQLNSHGVPVVSVAPLTVLAAHTVCWDDYGAGSVAAARAAELGHKKIILTVLNYRNEQYLQPTFRRRIAGFADAAQELGLDVVKVVIHESEFADMDTLFDRLRNIQTENAGTIFADCSGLHPAIFGGVPAISIGSVRVFDHPTTDFIYHDDRIGSLAAERVAALIENPDLEAVCLLTPIRTRFILDKLK